MKIKIQIKIQIKRIILLITLFCLLIPNISNAIVYDYNNASFGSNSFNDGLPINTGNVAGINVQSQATFIGDILIEDSSYNIATFTSDSFNEGLPINSGKKAKVNLDNTIESIGDSLTNLSSYNIATFTSDSFNEGLPIDSGRKARVDIDNILATGTGGSLTSMINYNIATFTSDSFNEGLPIDSGKKAKVELDTSLGMLDGFLIANNTYFNLATMESASFNDGLAISSGKKAKVVIKPPVDEYNNNVTQSITETIDLDGSTTLVDLSQITSTGTISKIYTNAIRYVYQGKMDNGTVSVKIIENYDSSIDLAYSKINFGEKLTYGESGLFQKIIKTKRLTPDKGLINGDILTLSTIFLEEFVLNNEVNITDIVLPPVLTYPYKTLITSGSTGFEYNIKTPYPTIKGMAMPKSVMEVYIGDYDNNNYTTHYINVDKYGLFSFDIPYDIGDKYGTTGTMDIIFQYYMLDNGNNLSEFATQKLKNPIRYNTNLKLDEDFDFPYILSMYNDDYIYTDLLKLEGYGNEGVLNYELYNLNDDNTKSLLKNGTTKVGTNNRFDFFLLGDENQGALLAGKYVVKVWQTGFSESKAFEVVGDNQNNIGIFNYKDFDTIPSKSLKLIGYSKEGNLNNNLLRVELCEIGSGTTIGECNLTNKEFLGTTNPDQNGFFKFDSFKKLKDGSTYELDIYNTKNLGIHKKLILNVDNSLSAIVNSDIVNIYSGLKTSAKKLVMEGYTLPLADITVNLGLDTKNFTAGTNGMFKIIIDSSNNITDIGVTFSSGSVNYKKDILLEVGENTSNTVDNYYQNFRITNSKIINTK